MDSQTPMLDYIKWLVKQGVKKAIVHPAGLKQLEEEMDKVYKISNYKYRSPTKTAKLQEHVITFKAHMAVGLKGCQCRHCQDNDCTQCAMAIFEGLF